MMRRPSTLIIRWLQALTNRVTELERQMAEVQAKLDDSPAA